MTNNTLQAARDFKYQTKLQTRLNQFKPALKDYKLKKSFRVPNIDVMLHDIKNEMSVYHSFKDLDERVVQYMNAQHELFLKEIASKE